MSKKIKCKECGCHMENKSDTNKIKFECRCGRGWEMERTIFEKLCKRLKESAIPMIEAVKKFLQTVT